jgi:hypothetical protein
MVVESVNNCSFNHYLIKGKHGTEQVVEEQEILYTSCNPGTGSIHWVYDDPERVVYE